MTKDLLLLEPFYGGSHKQLIDTLIKELQSLPWVTYDLYTLPAKKWPWKARCGALILSEVIPEDETYKTLFCSSDLSLSELLGIRPDLQNCRKVVYFHENQLVYPVQKTEALDFQFGFNQILSALAADSVHFNSEYNMNSFLQSIPTFLRNIPGYKSKFTKQKVEQKCKVTYFPIEFKELPTAVPSSSLDTNMPRPDEKKLHIVWAHRWEHDKDPESFFNALFELQENGVQFQVSILGQGFTDVPAIFSEAKSKLKGDSIRNWGYLSSKEEYFSVLRSCDVAVSTAQHEFFGVSMMECAYCGCYPLCPNRLSYPELYPTQCLYNTSRQLYKRLREFCHKPWLASELRKGLAIDFSLYSWESGKEDLLCTLGLDIESSRSESSAKVMKLELS